MRLTAPAETTSHVCAMSVEGKPKTQNASETTLASLVRFCWATVSKAAPVDDKAAHQSYDTYTCPLNYIRHTPRAHATGESKAASRL